MSIRNARRWGLAVSALAATAVLVPAEATADPTFGVMNASGGIYWRSAPDWNTAVAVAGNGFYPNSTIAVHCYQSGAGNVPGTADTMWEQASVVSGSGTGGGWINEHFINDGSAINQPSPGVPPCNAPPPAPIPPPTPAPGPAPSGGNLVFPVYNADGGVYYRNSPNQSDTSRTPGVGVYNGDQVKLICGQFGGAGPNGNTAWSYVQNLTRPSIGNGWVNEHFINDGAAFNALPAGEQTPCPENVSGASGGSAPPRGSSTPSSQPGSGPPAASSCPRYMVIESRGSGEPYNPKLDPIGQAFAKALRDKHPGANVVATLANPYPAVGLTGSWREFLNLVGVGFGIGPLGAYHASVVKGKQWLGDNLASEIKACSGTRLLLVGYSQGAQVTGDVYQRSLSSAQRAHVLGVALFGDPYFNSSDDRVDRGSYSHTRGGVLGTRGKFASGQPVLSYCHAHDPICNWPGNVAELAYYRLSRHSNYASDGTAGSAGARY